MPTTGWCHECERGDGIFDIFFRRFQDLRESAACASRRRPGHGGRNCASCISRWDLTPGRILPQRKSPQAFEKFETIENLKMCLLRAEWRPPTAEGAGELGAIVDDIAIYKTVAETEDPAAHGDAT